MEKLTQLFCQKGVSLFARLLLDIPFRELAQRISCENGTNMEENYFNSPFTAFAAVGADRGFKHRAEICIENFSIGFEIRAIFNFHVKTTLSLSLFYRRNSLTTRNERARVG